MLHFTVDLAFHHCKQVLIILGEGNIEEAVDDWTQACITVTFIESLMNWTISMLNGFKRTML
ncbi:hypothetical protein TSUD_154170, partial [Trifolium subterraneum]